MAILQESIFCKNPWYYDARLAFWTISRVFTWRNPGILSSWTVFSQFFMSGLEVEPEVRLEDGLEVDWTLPVSMSRYKILAIHRVDYRGAEIPMILHVKTQREKESEIHMYMNIIALRTKNPISMCDVREWHENDIDG